MAIYNLDQDAPKVQFTHVKEGAQSVADDITPHLIVHADCEIQELYAVVKTAPTGAALIAEIEYYDSSWHVIGTVTIADGAFVGSTTALAKAVDKNDKLRLNVNQIGSGAAGSDLTVHTRGVLR